MNDILNNLVVIGPATIISWALVLISTKRSPQHLRNCFLLMNSLFWTLLFIAALFGENMNKAIVFMMFAIYIFLFSVPLLLIFDGYLMLKKEGFSIANILSLVLGLVILVGEFSLFIYVLFHPFNEIEWHFTRFFFVVGMSVFYFSFVILSFVLYTIFVTIMPHTSDINYIIIHGCGLKPDGTPSNILRARVDKAIKVYKRYGGKPYIIPSGGQGRDEVISEAQSMTNYMVSKGIPIEKIIMEDKSTTTMENLIYSKKILDQRKGKKKIALVTSNYHVYRCLSYAKQIKLNNCIGVGAHIATYYWPSALIRECVAVYSKTNKLSILMGGYAFLLAAMLWRG